MLVATFKAVERLRNQHRIMTIPFGTLANFTQQNTFNSLPCLISPESVSLGVEGGFVRVFEDLQTSVNSSLRTMISQEGATSFGGPIYQFPECFEQVPSVYAPEPQDITNRWPHPQTAAETNKYKVFRDLHARGYFLTSGDKFGCDFLVYPNDPILHHAQYMIYVQDLDKPLEPLLFVSIGRLANSVHKIVLFASHDTEQDRVRYVSLDWFNPQPIKPWKLKTLSQSAKNSTKQQQHYSNNTTTKQQQQ